MPEVPDPGALGDVIVAAIEKLLLKLFDPVRDLILSNVDDLVKTVVNTPYPNAVFNPPTNKAWPAIYDYYWDAIIPMSLFLWAASIGLVIFFETTSHLFSSYHRTKLKKRAFTGLLGVLSWWWMAALSLRFVSALATFITPELSDVTLFETLSFGSMSVLGIALSLMADFVLFALIGLIYIVREYVLYLFVLLMPILIVLWIPGVGPFSLVSRFVRRLAGFYVPFLFMTVPVAVLFRLGELLGASVETGDGGFWLWLSALVIPLLAVVVPIVMIWQAGAVFFVADRASRHLSRHRAQNRLSSARQKAGTARQGSRNFQRGLRGDQPVDRNGQYKLGHGGSRAHAAGSRLRSTVIRNDDGNTGFGGGGSGGDNAGGGGDSGTADQEYSRTNNFETLRDRGGQRRDDGDDQPYYIN